MTFPSGKENISLETFFVEIDHVSGAGVLWYRTNNSFADRKFHGPLLRLGFGILFTKVSGQELSTFSCLFGPSVYNRASLIVNLRVHSADRLASLNL
jgi:hypothetical protein